MKGNSNPANRSSEQAAPAGTTRPAGEGFNLNSTAEAFKARFQQQKKEQDQALSDAEAATKNRHRLMVQALTTIRRSLLELRRIELGERFRLEINADEWRGWPRISVVLADNIIRNVEYPKFVVTANDRQEKGLIEINTGAQPTATMPAVINLPMRDDADLSRLPVLLKRAVRNYLDTIAQTILDAEKKLDKELEDAALTQKNSTDFDERRKDKQPELSGDLFEDHIFSKGPFEVLDSVGDVGSLPGLDESGTKGAVREGSKKTAAQAGQRQKETPQEKPSQANTAKKESSKLDAVEDLFLSEMLKD